MRPSVPVLHVLLAAAAALVLLAACGKGKDPKTLPSQTVSKVEPALEAPPPLPPPVRRPEPAAKPAVKVIDPGEVDPQPTTLIEASRLARARKGESPPPVVEINDENLHEYSEGADVIVVESSPAVPAAGSASASDRADGADGARADRDAPGGDADEETYWRRRGLDLRQGWRQALDEIESLELEVAAQRQRFYAEDDPYVRDARIKPAWDRALDRLRELRAEAGRYQEALIGYLDEGRQLEIPPGWLNDGWELEPTDEERREIGGFGSVTEPIDTPIVEDPASDVGSGGGTGGGGGAS